MNALLNEIKEALSGHGHDCICDGCMEKYHHTQNGFDEKMAWRLLAAALFFGIGLITKDYVPTASEIIFVLALLCAGYDVLVGAVADLFHEKLFEERLLMSIAAITAVFIGEPEDGALLILLFRLGTLIRGYAFAKVRSDLTCLMENRSDRVKAVIADVQSQRGKKSRAEEFIAGFCRVYTPIVAGISVILAVIFPVFFNMTVTEGIYRALVIMVVACPCALALSVPLGYFTGIGGAVRLGVLFKTTAAVDAVNCAKSIVFDKAGVLEGEELHVNSVKGNCMDPNVMLRIAAHACAYSDGKYAKSIEAAYKGDIYIELVQSHKEENQGITVVVDGVKIVIGQLDFVRENGVEPGDDAVEDTAAYLGIDGRYAGRITFGTSVKPDVPATVTVLSWGNDRQIALVTDDSPAATEIFAHQAGIERYYARCSDKAAVVRQLKGRLQSQKGTLLFVGPADSDSACMQAADVGVSLQGAQSDAAMDTADVVVMDNAPSKIVTAIEAARQTCNIVWQNIVFALFSKAIILTSALFLVCPLWLAVLADVGTTLLTVLNSLRALRLNEPALPE